MTLVYFIIVQSLFLHSERASVVVTFAAFKQRKTATHNTMLQSKNLTLSRTVFAYCSKRFMSRSQALFQKAAQQQQAPQDDLQKPLLELRNIKLLERDPIATFIPPEGTNTATSVNDFSKLTPEELQKLNEDQLLKRMEKGFEYNPFQAAKLKQQGLPIMDKNETLKMQTEMKQNIEKQRNLLEDYLKKEGDKLPAQVRRSMKMLLIMEKALQEKMTKSVDKTTSEQQQPAQQQQQQDGSANSQVHPDLQEMFENARRNKEEEPKISLLGYIVSGLIGSMVAIGLAVPGFKQYILVPLQHWIYGTSPDPNRIY